MSNSKKTMSFLICGRPVLRSPEASQARSVPAIKIAKAAADCAARDGAVSPEAANAMDTAA